MKQKRIGNGILAIVLALATVVGLTPIAAIAEGELGAIASFTAPITSITVEVGTEIADIGLPDKLAAAMDGGESQDVPVT